jgi:hypothetical protein
MVEQKLPKLTTRVRFPSPAPTIIAFPSAPQNWNRPAVTAMNLASAVVIEFAPVFNQNVAADGFPEAAHAERNAVAHRAHRNRAFLEKKLPHVDTEDFFIFADRALVVHQGKHLPADIVAWHQHADGLFHFVGNTDKPVQGIVCNAN